MGQAFLRVRQQASGPHSWTRYFAFILVLTGLAAAGLLVFGTNLLAQVLLDIPDLPYGVPYGIFVFGMYAGTLVEQEAIADQDGRRLLWYAAGSYMLQIAAFAVPLLLGYGLEVALWALSLSTIYRAGWLLYRYMSHRAVAAPPPAERALFWSQTSALTVYSAFAVVVVIIDHFLVGHWSDTPRASLALWRYGSQELPLVVGVVAGLNATALAERQQSEAYMLSGLLRRSRRSVKYLLALACVVMVVSPYVYGQVLNESLYPAHVICNTMLLVLPSRLVQTQPLMISQDLQRHMLSVGIMETILNVAVSLALLPMLGLLGIAIGTVAAYTFERVAYVVLLARRGYPVATYVPSGWLAVMTALLLALYFGFTDFGALGVG